MLTLRQHLRPVGCVHSMWELRIAMHQPVWDISPARRSSTTAGLTSGWESRSTHIVPASEGERAMRCSTCAGRGWVRNEASDHVMLPAVPCPRCAGSGYDHCCEGSDASCEVIVSDPKPSWFPLYVRVDSGVISL